METYKERQIKLFKTYSIMLLLVTLSSFITTAYDCVENGNKLDTAYNNLNTYSSILNNILNSINKDNIYNIAILGINIFSVIENIFKFLCELLHNTISFIIISISTIIQSGTKNKIKMLLGKIINTLAIAEIIAYFLAVLNIDIAEFKNIISLTTIVFIVETIGKLSKLIILSLEAIIIFVFTFINLDETEKYMEEL